jgi:alpha-L-fucosidase
VYGKDFEYSRFFEMFKAEMYNASEWAGIFADAGAQYVYMTAKHSDGFALWPSPTNRTKSTTTIGRDLYGELAKGLRGEGLRVGVFYEMEDYFRFGCGVVIGDKEINCPREQSYAQEFIVPELYDLAKRYEPDLVYADGDWSGNSSFLGTKPFLAWLFNDSPMKDTVVVNDRWGSECRTKHGGYYLCEYDPTCTFDHPFAVTMGFGASFGYSREEEAHPEVLLSSTQLVHLLVRTVARGGNLEINVGPTGDGRIPSSMQVPLKAVGNWLRLHGEAIYNTTGFPFGNTDAGDDEATAGTGCTGISDAKSRISTSTPTSTSTSTLSAGIKCYTRGRGTDTLYVTFLGWVPHAATASSANASVGAVHFDHVVPTAATTITVLGMEKYLGDVNYSYSTGAGVDVHLPTLPVSAMPGNAAAVEAWVMKITGVKGLV